MSLHVFLLEVRHAFFCLLHLLLCHALEGLLAVLVHVDGELVNEVFGLYVGSISIQDMTIGRVVHLHFFLGATSTTALAIASSSLRLHVHLCLLLLLHTHRQVVFLTTGTAPSATTSGLGLHVHLLKRLETTLTTALTVALSTSILKELGLLLSQATSTTSCTVALLGHEHLSVTT